MATPHHEAPKEKHKESGGLKENALLTAIIAAVVSGIISFMVANYQNHYSSAQATAAQQTQQVIRLEADAKTLNAMVTTEYRGYLACDTSEPQIPAPDPKACDKYNSLSENPIQGDPELSQDVGLVYGDIDSISDVTVDRAADSYVHAENQMIYDLSATIMAAWAAARRSESDINSDLFDFDSSRLTQYGELIKVCGKFILANG